jgi:hypothetical protein
MPDPCSPHQFSPATVSPATVSPRPSAHAQDAGSRRGA